MKTCKTGCGKMKEGGKVTAIKKMAKGGSIFGMPQYTNNPRTDAGHMLKKGGTVAVTNRTVGPGCTGGMVKDANGKCVNERKFKSGGSLKPVPAGKVGLAKLPTAVRNKMGFQKKGGTVKK